MFNVKQVKSIVQRMLDTHKISHYNNSTRQWDKGYAKALKDIITLLETIENSNDIEENDKNGKCN
jgi:hypothetical protein